MQEINHRQKGYEKMPLAAASEAIFLLNDSWLISEKKEEWLSP